jgi:hypothetical protein
MIDVRKASVEASVRLLATRGFSQAQPPGTLSPDPWHFALWASSTVLRQGDATALTASPVPLDCRGARGACQQSPILRSSICRLPGIPGNDKGYWMWGGLGWGTPLNIVPLAQSEKCRGFGGRAPKNAESGL